MSSFADFFNQTQKRKQNNSGKNASPKKKKLHRKKNSTSTKKNRPTKAQNNSNHNNKNLTDKTLPLLSFLSNDGNNYKNENSKRNTTLSKLKINFSDSSRSSSSGFPSKGAQEFQTELKRLSTEKRFNECFLLYTSSNNDNIRDSHHASIFMDCCVRCGFVDMAESIMVSLLSAQKEGKNDASNNQRTISIQTSTCLLKGYSHAGHTRKAFIFYHDYLLMKGVNRKNAREYKFQKPNVRTLNTFLRGCLWSTSSSHGNSELIDGGVVASEKIFSLSPLTAGTKMMARDASSYEYSIMLLSQAFRFEEAQTRFLEMRNLMKASNQDNGQISIPNDDEAILSVHMSLARAYALVGNFKSCRESANQAITLASNSRNNNKDSLGKYGGKRSWKRTNENKSEGIDQHARRDVSNQLFRSHRQSEFLREAKSLLHLCSLKLETDDDHHKKSLAYLLMTRLLYFSGGGTTTRSSTHSLQNQHKMHSEEKKELLETLCLSFGLGRLIPCMSSSPDENKVPSTESVESFVGSSFSPIDNQSGYLDFKNIFGYCAGSKQSKKESAIDSTEQSSFFIELGAGSGDWIVQQSLLNPNPHAKYISVELRADRVYQTFIKAFFASISKSIDKTEKVRDMSVCCVGSDCESFLKDRIPLNSIEKIYVNHPEPPTQTFSLTSSSLTDVLKKNNINNKKRQDEEEPSHMLNYNALLTASQRLLQNGKGELVIVTDNKWYAVLICNTLQKLLSNNPNLLKQKPIQTHHKTDMYSIEDFYYKFNDKTRYFSLYEGQPGEEIGHFTSDDKTSTQGSSYFDRLWRTGAGKHASQQKRFIIILQTASDSTNTTSTKPESKSNKKKKKKSTPHKKNINTKKKIASKEERTNDHRLSLLQNRN